MLKIDNLHVEVGGKEILHGITMHIKPGETHVLMGPNGSGKSTLLMTIMGFDAYHVTRGSISFNGSDVTHMPVHERARLGMGIMFQRPPSIPGLKLGKMLDVINPEKKPEFVTAAVTRMNMEEFVERDINLGFSGGEIKRSEILQMMVQDPSFIMLDEPESGVDLENIHLMGESIARLLQKNQRFIDRKNSGLVITHTGYILDYLDVDKGHVMINGEFKCHGNPREILKLIKEKGYKECLSCAKIL
ncbi:ABC transporter ATP-binding protein [Methanospirillum stamsii]|uniref:ABC transporter ATP-binding protein n=1 Tax=Methanospirillum stamsii TaxID=1277351 RepID=A0A2V2N0L2_9EURY|nr:ABC transporter ATP-binding protein [Methanospirillum stamsii]PWR70068.1 ABC transporter ATP-binding protein [Methanospirillum stamsii]